MCIALITDYDVGLEDDPTVKPVSHEEVLRVFSQNIEKLRNVLFTLIDSIPAERSECLCTQV